MTPFIIVFYSYCSCRCSALSVSPAAGFHFPEIDIHADIRKFANILIFYEARKKRLSEENIE